MLIAALLSIVAVILAYGFRSNRPHYDRSRVSRLERAWSYWDTGPIE